MFHVIFYKIQVLLNKFMLYVIYVYIYIYIYINKLFLPGCVEFFPNPWRE